MNSRFSQIMLTFDDLQVIAKKSLDDSDQDTNDTTSQCSQDSQTKLLQVSAKNNIEIDVKPKQKKFFSPQEKHQFVSHYQNKWKTELCKNYMLKGSCKYGNTCCFAHGHQELITQNTQCNSSSKTKPCKKYFLNGYCPYGYRCQYLHHDIQNCPQFYNFLLNLYKSKSIVIDTRLPELYSNELKHLSQTQKLLPVSSRLSVFQDMKTGNI